MDIRPTVDAPDDDPRLWLEAIEGARAVEWVRDQNARTAARFADRTFEADRDALAGLLDRPDRIPYVGRRAGLLYNFWQDAANPRGLWRRTDEGRPRSPDPTTGRSSRCRAAGRTRPCCGNST